jgi:3-oxoacyl-[acyl-carrier protein] reductase
MGVTSNSHVIVTGGSRGLGLALIRHLSAAGHRVTTISRTVTPELRDVCDRSDGAVVAIEGDLRATCNLTSLVAAAEQISPCTALVNCAAIVDGTLLVTQDEAAIQQMIALNLTAPILLSKVAAKRLFLRRSGRIVNVSSIAAQRALRGLAVYGAAKAGLEHFTRSLAAELGGRGITVNAVAPGFITTDMSSELSEAQTQAIVRRTPIGRTASVDEVCGVIAYLVDGAPLSLTGQVITVDGGFSL